MAWLEEAQKRKMSMMRRLGSKQGHGGLVEASLLMLMTVSTFNRVTATSSQWEGKRKGTDKTTDRAVGLWYICGGCSAHTSTTAEARARAQAISPSQVTKRTYSSMRSPSISAAIETRNSYQQSCPSSNGSRQSQDQDHCQLMVRGS